MSPTQNTPSLPGLVEALKHGHRREVANLNLFKNLLPRHFGINDELVPNPLLDLRLMPLFVIENLIITFDPDGPKHNTSKKVPNYDHLAVLFGNPLSKHDLFPIEAVIISGSNPTKFLHNECGPSPRPPSLDAIPEIMFDRLTGVGEAKHALFRD